MRENLAESDVRDVTLTHSSRTLDRVLPWVVGAAAGAVILVEIVLTRLFSVLLYYHYSFLAVALALFGLTAGGISASRVRFAGLPEMARVLGTSMRRAGIALLGLVILLVLTSPNKTSLLVTLVGAMFSAIPLFLLGKALAISMALGRRRIHRLYAIDLITSAAAALLTIPLLTRVQGPLVLAVPALLAMATDLLLTSPGRRLAPAACTAALATALVFAAAHNGPVLPLRDPWAGHYVLERWNAHSRVRVSDWEAGPAGTRHRQDSGFPHPPFPGWNTTRPSGRWKPVLRGSLISSRSIPGPRCDHWSGRRLRHSAGACCARHPHRRLRAERQNRGATAGWASGLCDAGTPA